MAKLHSPQKENLHLGKAGLQLSLLITQYLQTAYILDLDPQFQQLVYVILACSLNVKWMVLQLQFALGSSVVPVSGFGIPSVYPQW